MHEQFIGCDDSELVGKIRAAYERGDAAAIQAGFEIVQYRHQDRIRGRIALRLPAGPIDDMVQDIFLGLFEAIVAGTEIVHPRAWLNKVAANHVADHYRGRDVQHLKDAVSLDDDEGPVPAGEGGQGLAELEILIGGVLAPLSPSHRRVAKLAVFEGRPATEVAEASGESEANVYQIVRRFRVALRAAMDGENER